MRTYTVSNATTKERLIGLYSHPEFGETAPPGLYRADVYSPSKWEHLAVGETAPFTFNAVIRRDT